MRTKNERTAAITEAWNAMAMKDGTFAVTVAKNEIPQISNDDLIRHMKAVTSIINRAVKELANPRGGGTFVAGNAYQALCDIVHSATFLAEETLVIDKKPPTKQRRL